MRIATLTLALGCAALWLSPVSADDAKFDPKNLEGTWTFVSGMKAGTKSSDDELKKMTVTVKGDEMRMKSDQGEFVFKLTFDAKANPVAVDMEITDGPIGKGEKNKGIVELKGDEFKICYPGMGGDRPAKFDGEKNHLFVLKKKKADK